jgi:nucleotide-binding universal stress UspA family protein
VIVASPYAAGTLAAAAATDLLLPAEREEAAGYLSQVVQRLKTAAPDLAVTREVRVGEPAMELLAVERERHVQLVALTTHGRTGAGRWLRGSVAEELLRRGRAPILMIRPWDAAAQLGGLANAARARRVLVALATSTLDTATSPAATAQGSSVSA